MSQVNITIDEFIKLIKEYDFKKNSIRKFANEYKISEKTVTKYLRENNVDYNSRTLLSRKNRDVNGRFCLSINSFSAERVKDNKLKTIEKIKINTPTKLAFTSETYNKQNLSDKSYEEKLRCIMTPFK